MDHRCAGRSRSTPPAAQARRLLQTPDRRTLKGSRDFALLLLLLENALRRAEVVSLRISDYDREARSLMIRGKGRGTQQERVTLSATAINVTNTRVLLDNSLSFGGFHYNDPRQIYGEVRYRFHF